MPRLPGMTSDVFFGPTDKLPDWRDSDSDSSGAENDEDKITEEDRKALIAVLGFDPRDKLDD